jgi:hypothetical protein
MPHCADEACGRWRPRLLVEAGLGVRFEDAWYCSPACLEAETARRLERASSHQSTTVAGIPRARIGALLLHHQVITREQLGQGLAAQVELGLRLGQVLQRLGLASGLDVLKALAAQAGVAYLSSVDPSRFEELPAGFSVDTARVLGIVPFESDAETQTLKVACPAPLPRGALAAVREITGWSVNPFLVADEDWVRLLEVCAAAARLRARPQVCATVSSVSDAAALIADRAARGGARRMHYARCAPYVWVRLEGTQAEDVLLPLGRLQQGERRWQAEPTRH